MSSYGRKSVDQFGFGIRVSADGNPLAKIGGVTVEWASVTAASAAFTVLPTGATAAANFYVAGGNDLDYVDAGEKFLRFGTVLCKVSGGTWDGSYVPYGTTPAGGGSLLKTKGNIFIMDASMHESDYHSSHPAVIYGGAVWKNRIVANYGTIQTFTVTATGGTFILTYGGQSTSAQAYNVSAANLQTALVGLSSIGTGNATVALNSGVYTITLANAIAPHSAITANVASLTGGTGTVAYALDTASGPSQAELDAVFTQLQYVND